MVMPLSRQKRVLYYTRRKDRADELFRALDSAAGCKVDGVPRQKTITCGEATFTFVVKHDVTSALGALHHDFFNLVLLDLREPIGRRASRTSLDFERGLELLDLMDREPDIERRYGFHRILALVSGVDSVELDTRIATLGSRGVGHVMRDFSECPLHVPCRHLPSKSEMAGAVFEEIGRLTMRRKVGNSALCASGGGITGLYFELGAVKCFEDCCSPGTLNGLDLYFGISAGAVVTGMLANGYTVSEFMGAVAGEEGGRLPPFDLNLLDASHLDVRGLTAPIRQLITIAGRGIVELLRGRVPFSLESLVFEYGDLIHAPFNTDGFEDLLRSAFSREGCSNDFRMLGRRLYVGATDHDRKEHVLFGAPPFDRIPVSRAIQASMSINPVFAPTEIGGRYYVDGAVTRTSNFVEAIRMGADLIIALDPLVPWVAKRPGEARERGVFWNADQDIRTVSFTRFDTTRNWVLRRHPEVSLYTFLPANNLRQIMSVNPMDHRPFLEIWRGAYLSTLKRVHALGYRMKGDLAAHGIWFDTARADEVAARLARTEKLRFSDFFPDARVDLRVPGAAKTRHLKLAPRRHVASVA
jgi:predicted acylesterase/phospholipase RssA